MAQRDHLVHPSSNSLDSAARQVLDRYPDFAREARLVALGNGGGFSGARLWRVRSTGSDLCLRAWPPDDPSPAHLATTHECMKTARAARLDFVPQVLATREGATWVEQSGRLWEITTWMPGHADFYDQPSLERLQNACVALARIHMAWSKGGTKTGRCPGIERRLERAREWLAVIDAGWQPCLDCAENDPVAPWARRAWQCVRGRIHTVLQQSTAWATQVLPLQPCLCDIWHDHVLFEGNVVTGVVDYGGVKVDHVSVDLARLLGSLARNDPRYWAEGLRAYRCHRSLSLLEERLTKVLDETGIVVGAANWLRWLYREGRRLDDRHAVGRRLAELVTRIEALPPAAG